MATVVLLLIILCRFVLLSNSSKYSSRIDITCYTEQVRGSRFLFNLHDAFQILLLQQL